MSIPNFTTKIAPEKTIGEIQQIMVKKGADKFICDYKDGIPSAVTFSLNMGNTMTYFSIQANYDGMLRAMKKDPRIANSFCTRDQAIRVSWRVVKTWIVAQLAIIEAGIMEMPEAFLSYAVTNSGSTLYQEIKTHSSPLLLTQ